MKHVRTYGSTYLFAERPAFDATPEVRCTSHWTADACVGMCPRHTPAVWSEHMARHAPDSLSIMMADFMGEL